MDKHGFEISEDAKDLIGKLLIKDKNQRLGSARGIEEVLSHPWLSSINIAEIRSKKTTAPYIPDVRYEADTHHFDSMYLDLEVAESFISDSDL
mmetsp:Transcript_23226/g.22799  ORF Transcript_23226/g.22799 Transcript_23226/m.22799 type:complete len:93 (-) Transcript_23226:65-343(-)